MDETSRDPLAAVGATAMRVTGELRGAASLAEQAAVAFLVDPAATLRAARPGLVAQVWFTGIETLPAVVAVGFVAGLVVTARLLALVPGDSGLDLLGGAAKLLVVPELGPMTTMILVTARSGTAIAADVGLLVRRGAVADAARSVVFPRLVGVPVATVGLCAAFLCAALTGGVLAARRGGVPVQDALRLLGDALAVTDVAVSMAQAAVFGLVIASIATWQGLAVREELDVPRAARSAVTYALVACFALDGLLLLARWGALA
jgi:phospholipid/cholesterol/gamma-HCH transport system permease protein